ncbi:MAG: hypothetical protein JRG84_10900, partial [Deltaproteobacteria bacterium]|nr:hypothetical protein [Deltaproteobacteria bacterium]
KEEHRPFVGMSVAEIAAQQGKRPFDALLDLVVADDLKTYFKPPTFGNDDESWRMRGEAWVDDRTVVGASDAGAHLDMIDTFAFSTQILGEGRRRKLITTEEAVHQLTEVPAQLFGRRARSTSVTICRAARRASSPTPWASTTSSSTAGRSCAEQI